MTDSGLKSIINDMLSTSIVIGPALTAVGIGGLDPGMFGLIERESLIFTRRYWNGSESLQRYQGLTIPSSVVHTGFLETLSSTAAYLSHLRLGYLNIDEPMVRVAVRLLEQFMDEHSVDDVLTLIFMVNSYDNMQVLKHYGRVNEKDFVTGALHRPWVHYSLQEELEIMLRRGNAEMEHSSEGSFIRLTQAGLDRFQSIKQFFAETGFLRRRASLLRLSEFSHLEDYDELIESVAAAMPGRRRLLEVCEIQEGMDVLELGAGTGNFTIDAGLYKLVGPSGSIIATEPSFGMLQRGKRKSEALGLDNVRWVQAVAEEIPFQDNSFDAVTGAGFMHFTDIPVVLREVHRVLKPGGIFSTYMALRPAQPRFMAEWFKPLMALANPSSNQNVMPGPDTAPPLLDGLFEDAFISTEGIPTYFNVPENAVRFFVQVANVFEDAMDELPWKAKEDMLQLLIQRGHDVVKTYPPEELVPVYPCQIIRARVKK